MATDSGWTADRTLVVPVHAVPGGCVCSFWGTPAGSEADPGGPGGHHHTLADLPAGTESIPGGTEAANWPGDDRRAPAGNGVDDLLRIFYLLLGGADDRGLLHHEHFMDIGLCSEDQQRGDKSHPLDRARDRGRNNDSAEAGVPGIPAVSAGVVLIRPALSRAAHHGTIGEDVFKLVKAGNRRGFGPGRHDRTLYLAELPAFWAVRAAEHQCGLRLLLGKPPHTRRQLCVPVHR